MLTKKNHLVSSCLKLPTGRIKKGKNEEKEERRNMGMSLKGKTSDFCHMTLVWFP
jgi:hypothetical protein